MDSPSIEPGQGETTDSKSQKRSSFGYWALCGAVCWLLGGLGPELTGKLPSSISDALVESAGGGLVIYVVSWVMAWLIGPVFPRARNMRFPVLVTLFALVVGGVTAFGNLRMASIKQGDNSSINTSPATGTNNGYSPSKFVDPALPEEEVRANVYRNRKYRFRISFPEGWEIKDAASEHVVKQAELQNKASVSVLAQNDETGSNSNDVSDEDLLALGASMGQEAVKVLDGNLLSTRIVHINNQKAVCIKSKVTYRKLSGDYDAIMEQYAMLRGGFLWLLTASASASEYDVIEPEMTKAVDSFVFEDWGEKDSE